MTLSTHVLVSGPVTHQQVFDKVNDLLNIPANRATVSRTEDGEIHLDNQIAQGFDAWVLSKSRKDGQPFVGEHDTGEWACEEDCDHWRHVVSGYEIDVDMDTAYGYRGDNGDGCADLHARVIVGLVQWASETSPDIEIRWLNEFTGEVHTGLDGIADFTSIGGEAQAWFTNTVLPSISLLNRTTEN